jgi:very-short-patch-repair endonuclease
MTIGGMKPFRVADARELGVSQSRIRSREFATPFHGVRAAHGVEAQPEALARAYAVKMRRDGAFSHVTAAQLLGAPLPLRFGASPLHITVPTGTAPVRGRGIVGHHCRYEGSPIVLRGLRVLPPPVAWLTLGERLDLPDLVAVADSLVTATRYRAAWCEVDDLLAAVLGHPRVRGRSALRGALAFVRPGAASRPESLLRVLLVAAGFPEPELNFAVPKLPYKIDLAWPEFKFGLEYDGRHHAFPGQARADSSRQEFIHDREWQLMRVQKEDLFDEPRELVARVSRRLAARGLGVALREISGLVLPRR